MLVRLLGDDRGSNAIEYGLIVGLISLAIMIGAASVTVGLNALFTAVVDESKKLIP